MEQMEYNAMMALIVTGILFIPIIYFGYKKIKIESNYNERK